MLRNIRTRLSAVAASFAPRKDRPRRRRVRQFFKRQDGSAAIEFGFVAAPFLALILAIMETSLVFFAGQSLESATAYAARLIMTGQAQSGNFDKDRFKNAVCSRIFALFDCANGVYVDVKTYNNFASIDPSLPLDANGNLMVNSFGYTPGGPGDIVVVRIMYQWPVYVSLLGLNLADMAGNKRLLVATAAFRNEPY